MNTIFSGEHTLNSCPTHSDASQSAVVPMSFVTLRSRAISGIWMGEGEEDRDYVSGDDGELVDYTQGVQEFAISNAYFHPAGEYQKTKAYANYVVIQNEELSFTRWVKQWYVERGVTSSLSDMIACPSYLNIIAMGEKALPLILAQLRREGDDPDHWCVALKAITDEDPVPEDAYGDTVKMAKAWLLWAEEKNVW